MGKLLHDDMSDDDWIAMREDQVEDYYKARAGRALAMRDEGQTFRGIGKQIGVSVERARQIVYRAERDREAQQRVDALRKQYGDSTLVEHQVEMSTRLRNCLRVDEISDLRQLDGVSADKLLRTPNLGRRSLRELESIMARYGLYLLPSLHDGGGWARRARIDAGLA